jgi:hypothetical protein
MKEMNTSFAHLKSNEDDAKSSIDDKNNKVGGTTGPPRRLECRNSSTGHLERVPETSSPMQKMRKAPVNRGVQRTPSNLVPEMRRRANQRDLFYDDDHLQHLPSNQMSPMSTHSPVTGENMSSSNNNVSKLQSLKNSSMHAKTPEQQSNVPTKSTTRTPIRCSITTTSKTHTQDPKHIAKLEEEKQKNEETQKKLEEAKECFQEGYDQCWKFQNSAGVSILFKTMTALYYSTLSD